MGGERKAKRNEIGKAPEESSDREGATEGIWKWAATLFCLAVGAARFLNTTAVITQRFLIAAGMCE